MDLPLFPLGAVLLPRGRMSLRIFERRYVDLVRDSMRNGEGFGIVHIERGAEVGPDSLPLLAPAGTVAKIVDWDQLDGGLLGITVAGEQRFVLRRHWRADSGLNVGEVELLDLPSPVPMREEWTGLGDLLQGLEAHPHVQRIGLSVDRSDAWQVAYGLAQLLPMDEGFKAELLTIDSIDTLMGELEGLLGDMGGEN